ncbi:hypothetical protein HYW20_06190 [Candidatus Woesearchaeota archaeon]|nr:hypothetical protein [Candidatus Woesearchaeota archaeon]
MKLKIEDLAKLLGKTSMEVEEMLRKQDVIDLNLNERKSKREDDDDLKIYE